MLLKLNLRYHSFYDPMQYYSLVSGTMTVSLVTLQTSVILSDQRRHV